MNIESAPVTARPRVFSGIQPSAGATIGNYLGAIKQWVCGQDTKENFFCIVDLHTLTVEQDPAEVRNQIRMLAGILLASGISFEKSTLFIQSHVSAHAEACWLLNCVTPLGWLNKMTQFKDKSAKQESVLTALLDYPVLMAADILLYSANEVPVGDDQKQHVELTRNIAERFNRKFGETFVVPEPVIPQTAARVMALNDPTVKMSKSDMTRGHAVRILDDPKEIEYVFKRAVTDPGNEIRFSNDPEKAGVNNLLGLYKALTGKTREQSEADFASARGYGDLKKAVAELVIEEFTPIRQRYQQFISDPAELDNQLARGAGQARVIAQPKLLQMMDNMGLQIPGGR